jgi:hypothetical protein
MVHSKRPVMAGQIKQFCHRFAQGAGHALGHVIPWQTLMRCVDKKAGLTVNASMARCKP